MDSTNNTAIARTVRHKFSMQEPQHWNADQVWTWLSSQEFGCNLNPAFFRLIDGTMLSHLRLETLIQAFNRSVAEKIFTAIQTLKGQDIVKAVTAAEQLENNEDDDAEELPAASKKRKSSTTTTADKKGRIEPLLQALPDDKHDYTIQWPMKIPLFEMWIKNLENRVRKASSAEAFSLFSTEIARASSNPVNRVIATQQLSTMVFVGNCKQLHHLLMESNEDTTSTNRCLLVITKALEGVKDSDGIQLRCEPVPTGRDFNDGIVVHMHHYPPH